VLLWARYWSKGLITKSLSRQFPRFLVSGGVAALANFGSRFLFSVYMSFEYAVTAAFFVGLATGFLLARKFVFHNSANSLGMEILYYLVVNLLALVQTWLLSVYLAAELVPVMGLQIGQASAHMAGIMLPTLTSYLGHKYFTFREHDS
jgi:putative flippase GtrA